MDPSFLRLVWTALPALPVALMALHIHYLPPAGAPASPVTGRPGGQQHLHRGHGEEAARHAHRLRVLHQGMTAAAARKAVKSSRGSCFTLSHQLYSPKPE